MTHPCQQFLKLYTGLENPDITFVTMRRGEPGKPLYNKPLREVLPTLIALNKTGSDIFFTVNRTDGRGRRFENIVQARTIYADYDDGVPESWILEPGLIVESSPGKAQAYWMLSTPVPPDEQWHGTERGLVWATGADRNVCDAARVLRLPGFINHKYPERPVTKLLRAQEFWYRLETIQSAYKFVAPPAQMAAGGAVNTLEEAEKRRRYEMWLKAAGAPAPSTSGRLPISRNWLFRKAAMGVRDFDLAVGTVADVLAGLYPVDYADALSFANDADRYATNGRGAAYVRIASGAVQMASE